MSERRFATFWLRMMPARYIVASMAIVCAANSAAVAQPVVGNHESREAATPAAAFAWNALIGGATSATRAWFGKRDVSNAFVKGMFGGAVHYSGKWIASRPSQPSYPLGLAGLAVSATGTSMVSNAGAGMRPFEELLFPVGPFRIRATPSQSRRVHFEVNAFEAGIVARNLARPGLSLNWTKSASYGGLVFDAPNKFVLTRGDTAAGLAIGPVVVISGFPGDAPRTTRHEIVHLHQHWFTEDAWGRPIEHELRRRVGFLRRLPGWLQLGIVNPALFLFDEFILGRAVENGALEPEAELFER